MGARAQRVAAIKHMTVVEINPGYLKLIAQYPQVAAVLSDPRIEIVVDDGRRWLRRHPQQRQHDGMSDAPTLVTDQKIVVEQAHAHALQLPQSVPQVDAARSILHRDEID